MYETMSRIIDMHASLVSRHIAIRPNSQWFNNDIPEANKIQRVAEKRWRKTGLEVHRQIFTNARNYSHKLINEAKRDHIRQKICEKKTIQRSFFHIVDCLLKYTKPGENKPVSDDTLELTETFSNYFIDKFDRTRNELDESDLSPRNDT